MNIHIQCSPLSGGEIIGNRVKVPNDPVTVIGEQAAKCHCTSEKARYAETRKSGNLLYVAMDRYLPQKVACLKRVCGGIFFRSCFCRAVGPCFLFQEGMVFFAVV